MPSPPGAYEWAGSTRRHDWRRIAALLGRRPDAELAKVISTHDKKVRSERLALGIPRYHPLRGFEDLIGQIPDSQVSRRAKCCINTVRAYRKKHDIPRVSRKRAVAERKMSAYLEELEKFFGS